MSTDSATDRPAWQDRVGAASGAAYVLLILVGNQLAEGSGSSGHQTGAQVLAHVGKKADSASAQIGMTIFSIGARLVGGARIVRSSFMPNLAQASVLRDSREVGRYSIELDADWTANGHCTAGYLASVAARAVLQDPRSAFPVVNALNARYLRVASPGDATVEVDPLRHGARRADWRVTMHAGGQLCVAALISTGDHTAPDKRVTPPDLPAQDLCVLLPTRAPGFDLPVMGVLPQYADPAGMTWLAGEPSGRGLAQGWVRCEDGAAPGVLSVIAAFDSIPLATFDLGLRGWAATVDLSVHVLGTPAPGPLRLRRRVRETAGDLVTLTCDMWGADSVLVATGLQLCTLRG